MGLIDETGKVGQLSDPPATVRLATEAEEPLKAEDALQPLRPKSHGGLEPAPELTLAQVERLAELRDPGRRRTLKQRHGGVDEPH